MVCLIFISFRVQPITQFAFYIDIKVHRLFVVEQNGIYLAKILINRKNCFEVFCSAFVISFYLTIRQIVIRLVSRYLHTY